MPDADGIGLSSYGRRRANSGQERGSSCCLDQTSAREFRIHDISPLSLWAADIAPDADTLTELAAAQERAGMLPEALRTIDLALGHSRSRQALVAKAWMLTFLAAYDEAAVVAREAHTLPPHDASAATVLAWALEHIGADPREIVAITGEAAERNPADPQAHKAHANALWLAGSADADTAYERAIELFDTGGDLDDTARHTKGWCLYRLRRYDEATELYLRVLVTQYEDPMSLMFDIGLAALEMGDAERAVAKYDTGLGLVSDADLRGRGQLAVGAFDLRQAVRRGLIPASPLVDDLLTRLEGRLARMPEYVRLEPVSIVKRPG